MPPESLLAFSRCPTGCLMSYKFPEVLQVAWLWSLTAVNTHYSEQYKSPICYAELPEPHWLGVKAVVSVNESDPSSNPCTPEQEIFFPEFSSW